MIILEKQEIINKQKNSPSKSYYSELTIANILQICVYIYKYMWYIYTYKCTNKYEIYYSVI